jgi:hypothetical protein
MVTEKKDLLLLFGHDGHGELNTYDTSFGGCKFFISLVCNVTDLKIKTFVKHLHVQQSATSATAVLCYNTACEESAWGQIAGIYPDLAIGNTGNTP